MKTSTKIRSRAKIESLRRKIAWREDPALAKRYGWGHRGVKRLWQRFDARLAYSWQRFVAACPNGELTADAERWREAWRRLSTSIPGPGPNAEIGAVMTDTFKAEREQLRTERKVVAEQRREQKRRAALQAATALGQEGVERVRLALLHDLTADTTAKHVRFILPSDQEVIVPRLMLRRATTEARRNKRMKVRLRVSIDEHGLHLRWASGGLNLRGTFHALALTKHERREALVVPFSNPGIASCVPTLSETNAAAFVGVNP